MPSRSFINVCRKASPGIAAAVGTAVCLSGGNAAAISGNFAASNGGNSHFVNNVAIKGFNNLVSFSFSDHGQDTHAHFRNLVGGIQAASTAGASVRYVNAGLAVPGAFVFGGTWISVTVSNKYIPVRFNSGGFKYGWIHVVSVDLGANNLNLDTWAYNPTGGIINTLDESITPKKLALSDGRVKLNWSNANEAGVARYEVQAKGANGAWTAVDASTPGDGSYAATVQAGEYRLVVENSDGSSRSINF